jgi:hypothetical protein
MKYAFRAYQSENDLKDLLPFIQNEYPIVADQRYGAVAGGSLGESPRIVWRSNTRTPFSARASLAQEPSLVKSRRSVRGYHR